MILPAVGQPDTVRAAGSIPGLDANAVVHCGPDTLFAPRFLLPLNRSTTGRGPQPGVSDRKYYLSRPHSGRRMGCSAQKTRRDESRRCTQECVRHTKWHDCFAGCEMKPVSRL